MLTEDRWVEFPFAGKTEEVLGVSAENAAETALIQGKTISVYLDALVKLGTYPELNDDRVRAQVEKEMVNSLKLSLWQDWVFIYHDGRIIDRSFRDPSQIVKVLESDQGRAIKSVMSEVRYEMMLEQERDEAWQEEKEQGASETPNSDDDFDDVPFDD